MEPDKFRKSRQAINRLCKNVDNLIEEKSLEASKEIYEEAYAQWETLNPLAEGEIQERSVKNLSVKINGLSMRIGKLKPAKKPSTRGARKGPVGIVWDEERVGQLSPVFLKKLAANMAKDKGATVCFGTTGKGIRPNYQIQFSNGDLTVFTGSGHKPLDKPLSAGAKKISKPFSHEVVTSHLGKK
ncbi:MAG: hypothetical protein KKF12_01055 [Proteobacteria bacterium]|nr:hypothetical protein [Desulfobacula sp.]MBU3951528.1 hypothetical protein [Pseudomonadota bacterium]MBU4129386.1 hypothetical protein [Pseudomonadota bacterium]